MNTQNNLVNTFSHLEYVGHLIPHEKTREDVATCLELFSKEFEKVNEGRHSLGSLKRDNRLFKRVAYTMILTGQEVREILMETRFNASMMVQEKVQKMKETLEKKAHSVGCQFFSMGEELVMFEKEQDRCNFSFTFVNVIIENKETTMRDVKLTSRPDPEIMIAEVKSSVKEIMKDYTDSRVLFYASSEHNSEILEKISELYSDIITDSKGILRPNVLRMNSETQKFLASREMGEGVSRIVFLDYLSDFFDLQVDISDILSDRTIEMVAYKKPCLK